MGYYDGMALDSERGSSYDVARTLKNLAPILVVRAGAWRFLFFLSFRDPGFRKDSNISGILLNRIRMLYPKMKRMIETGLAHRRGIRSPVIGYVPKENPVFGLESRHLGLVTPQEIGEIEKRLEEAGRSCRRPWNWIAY